MRALRRAEIASKDPTKVLGVSVPGVNFAMLVFVVGVGLAATSAAFRYFTQYAAASEWRKWLVLAFNWTAIVVGIGSLVTFFFGGVLASRAFD